MFERVENMNGSDTGHIIFDIRVERVNRTIFTLTGNITFRSPFTQNPDAYFVSIFFTVYLHGEYIFSLRYISAFFQAFNTFLHQQNGKQSI